MPPSTGISSTRSASARPLCGRAAASAATFTTIGRFLVLSASGAFVPRSGQTGTVAADAVVAAPGCPTPRSASPQPERTMLSAASSASGRMPTVLQPVYRRASGRLWAELGTREAVFVDVADRLVADVLIDHVRRRIREIGQEEAEAPTAIQLRLTQRGDERARVTAAPPFG